MTRDEAIEDLRVTGPGGICADCGHFACRHHGQECLFRMDPLRDDPCKCAGMLWQGHRLEMDCCSGPT